MNWCQARKLERKGKISHLKFFTSVLNSELLGGIDEVPWWRVCVGGWVLLFNVSLTFFFLNLFLKENQRGSYLVSFTNMTVTEKSANAHRHHLASCLSLRQVFMLDRHVGLTSNDNRHTHFMKQPKRLQKIK